MWESHICPSRGLSYSDNDRVVDLSYGDRAGRDCSITGSKDYQTLGNFYHFEGFDKSTELLILKQETGMLL